MSIYTNCTIDIQLPYTRSSQSSGSCPKPPLPPLKRSHSYSHHYLNFRHLMFPWANICQHVSIIQDHYPLLRTNCIRFNYQSFFGILNCHKAPMP